MNLLLPILIDFINMMNTKFDNFTFVFHATDENKDLISKKINNTNLINVEVISDDNIKKQILNMEIIFFKFRYDFRGKFITRRFTG